MCCGSANGHLTNTLLVKIKCISLMTAKKASQRKLGSISTKRNYQELLSEAWISKQTGVLKAAIIQKQEKNVQSFYLVLFKITKWFALLSALSIVYVLVAIRATFYFLTYVPGYVRTSIVVPFIAGKEKKQQSTEESTYKN